MKKEMDEMKKMPMHTKEMDKMQKGAGKKIPPKKKGKK